NCESFSIRRFDIDHQLRRAGGNRIRVMLFGFVRIDWSRGFFRIAKARTVTNQLALIPSGKKRKALWIGRTGESKKAVAVNSGVTGEQFVQFLAAHAFDRITPETFDCSDDGHAESKK